VATCRPAIRKSAQFVLVGNPLIVVAIMGLMGYRKRTSFLAGLTVAQINEFSLILAALGVSLGHIGTETLSIVTKACPWSTAMPPTRPRRSRGPGRFSRSRPALSRGIRTGHSPRTIC